MAVVVASVGVVVVVGMRLVHLPAARRKTLETLSHTALSTLHVVSRHRPDAAIVFNAANSPFLLVLRLRRIPVATHVDGLEWKRTKWSGTGRRYYRLAEGLAVRWSDALIADAQGIEDYYRAEFDAPTVQIAYGAPIIQEPAADRLAELGLRSHGYHLVVARFEPENHVDLAVDGYRASSAVLPLVVVGSAPYADAYTDHVSRQASGDPRVIQVGGIWDQGLLDQLYANAATYVHGHSVGGTNPSLLRAMGAGADVLAYDVNFNRDVIGGGRVYWSDAATLAGCLTRLSSIRRCRDGEALRFGPGLRARTRGTTSPTPTKSCAATSPVVHWRARAAHPCVTSPGGGCRLRREHRATPLVVQ